MQNTIKKNTPPSKFLAETDRESAAAHYDITVARSDSPVWSRGVLLLCKHLILICKT